MIVERALGEASDTRKNLIGSFDPHEGLRVVIVGGDEVFDRPLECANRAVSSAFDLASGQECEPAFDLVDPGAVGRREVHMEPGPFREPVPDERRLVSAVVVHDEMNLQVLRDLGFDGVEKFAELDRPMPAVHFADDFAG